MDTVSVEWYEVPEHATQIWSGRREEIAKAFLTLAATDNASATSIRDLRELVGGDTNNLRKSLEQMPGVVKILATPYKSRMTSGWYLVQEVAHLATVNHPGHVYPLTISKADLSRLPTVQVKLRPIDNEAETKRIYYQHYGRQNSGKVTGRVESGPVGSVAKWVSNLVDSNPDLTAVTVPLLTFNELSGNLTKEKAIEFINSEPNAANGVIAAMSYLVAIMNANEKKVENNGNGA